ncbi:sugar-binding domain-containing protein [Amycolatopsis sp. WGS_07]|uniref:sugar-binding domain-containing protein n=1 Tax=Amycolatopsis sp. WGS_07 TaxID=3076764 RepID=UPI003872D135
MTIAENAADPIAAEAVPRPGYPRPDRDRSARWLSLNGPWRFAADDGAPESITVPFAWETAASGVHRTWLEHGVYARTVTVPAEWAGHRVVLCFGAVHHRAVVSIDGTRVGSHVGGHSSFEFDVTDVLAPGRSGELTVEVEAPADKREIPHGKQRSIPRDDYDGVSFTPTSGIWQSVWLEARGRTYAAEVSVRGDSLTGFDIAGELAGDAPDTAVVVATLEGRETVLPVRDGRFSGRLEVPSPRLWSPESPHLYAIALRVGEGTTPTG